MAGLKLQPLSPEKDLCWENVPSVVRASLKAIAANMSSVKRWAERQEMELKLEGDRREELLRRLDTTDRKLRQLQAEENAEVKTRLASVDLRLDRMEERSDQAVDSLRQWAERSIDRTTAKVEELRTDAAEHRAQAQRATEVASASSAEALEKVKGAVREAAAETDVKISQVSAKWTSLQGDVHELKASTEARGKEAAHHVDRLVCALEDRLTRIQEDCARLEPIISEVRSDCVQRIDEVEQQLSTQIEESRIPERARIDRLQSEFELHGKHLQEHQRTTEGDGREAASRLAKAEARFKERVDAVVAEGELREKRFTESLETIQKQNAELHEVARVRGGELQKSLESTLREQGTWLGKQAWEAAQDAHQKASREAADGTALLKQRIEDQMEKLSSGLKDADDLLSKQLGDVQDKLRSQIEADRRASKALAEESCRLFESKIRETETSVDDKRQAGETQLRDLIEDVRRNTRREMADGDQRVETMTVGMLTREVESLRKAIEDSHNAAAAGLANHSEAWERTHTAHAETTAETFLQHKTRHSELSDEFQAMIKEQAEHFQAQLAEINDKVQATDLDLKLTAEELPAFWQRSVSALEQNRLMAEDASAKLERRIQGEADNINLLAKQMAASEEAWNSRVAEGDRRLQAQGASVQKEFVAVRAELTQIQSSHAEAGQAIKARAERQNRDTHELGRRHKEFAVDCSRRLEDIERDCSSARILSLFGEHVEGMTRSVVSRELQAFQREAIDSVEWKLDRCVQWLHSSSVKFGLNPHGTLFSMDRFREDLFGAPAPGPASERSRSTTRRKSHC